MLETEDSQYIDFHLHTEYSDGVLAPERVVQLAHYNGLSAIAITDHDKVTGIERAIKEGKKRGIGVIPGVEISTDLYHVLGLGIDPENKFLINLLRESENEQMKVCKSRIELLKSHQIPITLQKIQDRFPKSRLGKFNIYVTILEDPECRSILNKKGIIFNNQTYNQYLSGATDKVTSITVNDTIGSIIGAGGHPFIAHPFKDAERPSELDKYLKKGIGIEIQPNYDGRNEPFRKYARENKLVVTYGSDFHAGLFGRQMLRDRGENKLNRDLARIINYPTD